MNRLILFLPVWLFFLTHTLQEVKAAPTAVSINLCTDQLLLAFRDAMPIRLSPLAIEPAYNYLSQSVSPWMVVQPKLDDLILVAPKVVFAGAYSDKYLLSALPVMGIPVEVLPMANDFEQVRENIRRMGDVLSQRGIANRLIQALNERLGAIPRVATSRTALFYAPNGFTHGKGTIYDEILARAGLQNLASLQGIEGHGYLPLEVLIWHTPDYLILEDAGTGHPSMAQRLLHHPAIEKISKAMKVLSVDANLFSCAGFSSVLALQQIVGQL